MFAEKEETLGRLLAFRVGAGHFAIALEWVCGVREATDPESQVGVGRRTSFHGREIRVLDLRALGWGGSDAATAVPSANAQIVIGRGGEQVALLVDAAEGIVEAKEVRNFPTWIAPLAGTGFQGVALQPEGIFLVVDPEALLDGTPSGDGGSTGEA